MKLVREASETFNAEADWRGNSASLEVRYDNRGEPYREGVLLALTDGGDRAAVFLDTYELKRLHACLSKILGPALP